MAAGPVPLLLVDGNSQLYATLSHTPVRTHDGRVITAVVGFCSLLRAAIHRYLPQAPEVVVVWDGPDSHAHRQALFPAYKAHRTDLPGHNFLLDQVPYLRRVLTQYGVAHYSRRGAEGDDLIASIIAAEAPGRPVAVWSRDRDMYALITDHTIVLDTSRPPDSRWVRADDVKREYRVTPGQWVDYRTLVGDPSDGVPGAKGIGPVAAAGLLADGYRLEDLRDSPRSATGRGLRVREQWEQLLVYRDVLRMREDLDVGHVSTGVASRELPDGRRILDDHAARTAPQETRAA